MSSFPSSPHRELPASAEARVTAGAWGASSPGEATATLPVMSAGLACGPSPQEEQLVVYTCRKCRQLLFTEEQVMPHEPEAHAFRRRKGGQLQTTDGNGCTSFFLEDSLDWMEDTGAYEQKILCPNCATRVGVLKWSGNQCSCGSWVTPAIQFNKSKLDPRIRRGAAAQAARATNKAEKEEEGEQEEEKEEKELKKESGEASGAAGGGGGGGGGVLDEAAAAAAAEQEASVTFLVDLGFEAKLAKRALEKNGGDRDLTMAWLCSDAALQDEDEEDEEDAEEDGAGADADASASAASAPAAVNDEDLNFLVGLGFEKKLSRKALEKHAGDRDAAMAWLCSPDCLEEEGEEEEA